MKKSAKLVFGFLGGSFLYFLGTQSTDKAPDRSPSDSLPVEVAYESPAQAVEEVRKAPVSVPVVQETVKEEALRVEVVQEVEEEKKMDLPFLRVISIHDGDSIKLLSDEKKTLTIRLEGIDAPELGQEYGRKSKERLGAILKEQGGFVYMDKTGVDKYGRILAKLYLSDGRDVNEVAISNGLAWHFKKYNDEPHLDKAEREAKASGVGLWGLDVPPRLLRGIFGTDRNSLL